MILPNRSTQPEQTSSRGQSPIHPTTSPQQSPSPPIISPQQEQSPRRSPISPTRSPQHPAQTTDQHDDPQPTSHQDQIPQCLAHPPDRLGEACEKSPGIGVQSA